MTSNEELLVAILRMDEKLDAHIKDESPILVKAQTVLEIHGGASSVRARIEFINGWMEREKDRKQLRRAIIEKGVIISMLAIAAFFLRSIVHELQDIVRMWTK